MKHIILKRMHLVNFKGLRDFELTLNDEETTVCGENGTGKTTLFDAFLWLLFGKDSTGRSDSNFNIKTLDAQGKPIYRLEHSVEAVLSVDGREMVLMRKLSENWAKPRGQVEEVLKNHVTEFYVNGVKLATKREYDAEVNAIIGEDVFRMVTNPHYFTSMRPEAQKTMLFDLAGKVTDEEVAAGNDDYREMLAQLNGRSLEQFAKEVAAKKRACKRELDVIPGQVATARKLMPEAEDWIQVEAEIGHIGGSIRQIDAELTKSNEANEYDTKRRMAISRKINDLTIEIERIKLGIREEANKSYNDQRMKIADLENRLSMNESMAKCLKANLQSVESAIDRCNAKLTALRDEYRAINAEQLAYPEGAFVCPTCRRPLDPDDIAAKQDQMERNFNVHKAERIKANKQAGMAKKAEMEKCMDERNQIMDELENTSAAITAGYAELEQMRAELGSPKEVEPLFAGDERIIGLNAEIESLRKELDAQPQPTDNSELTNRKQELQGRYNALVERRAKRGLIMRAEKEIAELEQRQKSNAQQLADLEKWEYTAIAFQKEKDARLMERINGLFSMVSFRFVDDQLNGGEKLTCVCTVDGTPYPDVNNAGKFNAGLDIINAICKAKGITAPIFLDNRESVNRIIPTVSQIINLKVSNDKELTVK